jgi:hypothetical protein
MVYDKVLKNPITRSIFPLKSDNPPKFAIQLSFWLGPITSFGHLAPTPYLAVQIHKRRTDAAASVPLFWYIDPQEPSTRRIPQIDPPDEHPHVGCVNTQDNGLYIHPPSRVLHNADI